MKERVHYRVREIRYFIKYRTYRYTNAKYTKVNVQFFLFQSNVNIEFVKILKILFQDSESPKSEKSSKIHEKFNYLILYMQ